MTSLLSGCAKRRNNVKNNPVELLLSHGLYRYDITRYLISNTPLLIDALRNASITPISKEVVGEMLDVPYIYSPALISEFMQDDQAMRNLKRLVKLRMEQSYVSIIKILIDGLMDNEEAMLILTDEIVEKLSACIKTNNIQDLEVVKLLWVAERDKILNPLVRETTRRRLCPLKMDKHEVAYKLQDTAYYLSYNTKQIGELLNQYINTPTVLAFLKMAFELFSDLKDKSMEHIRPKILSIPTGRLLPAVEQANTIEQILITNRPERYVTKDDKGTLAVCMLAVRYYQWFDKQRNQRKEKEIPVRSY